MPDPATIPEIASAVTAILTALATFLTAWSSLKTTLRTPKLPKPPVSPVSAMIIWGDSNGDVASLPTYDPRMTRMGFGRFNGDNR